MSASRPPRWFIILPAHNEQDNLAFVLDDALETCRRLELDHEILVVDDGSTDRTPEIATGYAKRHHNVRVVHHPENRGFGAALLTGYAQARGDLVVAIPSDRQFRCADLKRCLPLVDNHQVVLCVRRRRRDPPGRRLLSVVYRGVTRRLFGLDVRDVNWVKIYHLDWLRRITLEARGPFLDTEILVKLTWQGARLAEIEVPHHPRIAGTASGAGLRAMVKTWLDLWRLYGRLRGTPQQRPQSDPNPPLTGAPSATADPVNR